MTHSPSDSKIVIDEVRSKAYWSTVIRPEEYDKEILLSNQECLEIVRSLAVSYRGWDYPHVDEDSFALGTNWASSWVNWSEYVEVWRLYQSGQFMHMAGLREERDSSSENRARALKRAAVLPGQTPPGYVDLVGLIWHVTEVFEFAARIAARLTSRSKHDSMSFYVEIGLNGIDGYVVSSADPGRWWRGYFPTAEDPIRFKWRGTGERLQAERRHIAVDAIQQILSVFRVTQLPRDWISSEQDKLERLGIGRDRPQSRV